MSLKLHDFQKDSIKKQLINRTYVGMNTDDIGSSWKAPAPMVTTDLSLSKEVNIVLVV